jgi:hypothetical protein
MTSLMEYDEKLCPYYAHQTGFPIFCIIITKRPILIRKSIIQISIEGDNVLWVYFLQFNIRISIIGKYGIRLYTLISGI